MKIRTAQVLLLTLNLIACAQPNSEYPGNTGPATDPQGRLTSTSQYAEWFVESQSGEKDLAKRLVADFRRGWKLMADYHRAGMPSADIADSLRKDGFNVILLNPGVTSHELPARTVSFLVMNREAGCQEITYERWEALERTRPTNFLLAGMGKEDITGVSTDEKHIHLAAFELPDYEDYLEIRTASLSPLGKGIVLFGLAGLLSGCTDKEDPPPPPPPTATPTASPQPSIDPEPPPTATPAPIGPVAPPQATIRTRERSGHRYPFGPGGRSIPIPLGPLDPRPTGQFGVLYTYAIEIEFPAGTAACPNTLKQSMRDTVVYGDGTVEKNPQPLPPSDPGGFDSTRWAPDPPPSGINPNTQTNADGTKSYLDTPGLGIRDRRHLPARKDTTYRFELFDCNGTRLDCKEMTYTLRIDRRGQVTMQSMTRPRPCQ
ncbi:MAG: hypothetical protein GY906_16980 [bacterium]|nr:hypothetical protein [bacterium]